MRTRGAWRAARQRLGELHQAFQHCHALGLREQQRGNSSVSARAFDGFDGFDHLPQRGAHRHEQEAGGAAGEEQERMEHAWRRQP